MEGKLIWKLFNGSVMEGIKFDKQMVEVEIQFNYANWSIMEGIRAV